MAGGNNSAEQSADNGIGTTTKPLRENKMKVCKDGRIWGQNNKEAKEHLGIMKCGGKENYVKKGKLKNHYWRTGGEFQKVKKVNNVLRGKVDQLK